MQKLIKEQEKNKVSDKDLKAFFEAENRKKKQYWVPEKRAGIVWKFEGDRYPIKISSKQVQKYYDQNKYKEFIDQPVQLQVQNMR